MVTVKLNDFNLEQIADSGQCFRMNKISDNEYFLIAFGKCLKISALSKDEFAFDCSKKDFDTIWKDYFDLDTDYSLYKNSVDKNDIFLQEAIKYGYGIRILRQELWETTISFIISQRKSIPAIKSAIESLSASFGSPIYYKDEVFYAFPTPKQLAISSLEELSKHGLGYRDKYIHQLSNNVSSGEFDLDKAKNLNYDDAFKFLTSIYGIGTKIANCIALFSLHKIEAFPIDVWIKRILEDEYNNNFDISRYDGYAGILQQYMFYYARSREYSKIQKNK
ncbi:N-glycosylase/DNA lyase [Acetitomaculum ruminis DSM 5522]|uniref:DNA-(apurinic or apyrimidinic site) lyase n=1 Tax=Acetitomaculum ruminis DSM 5522 TaxID=1120918 RepID=A0A1I0Z4M2_9FIRM|nr:DNA glycosylase [Acetitomaculum ruminis]SFB20555.1 N-glycosylase/DNA lyase [Acetitomaculum ruminis DSM 5522]